MPANIGYLTAKTDKASDEVYTPEYAVLPLLKYLKAFNPNAVIWCPFDMEYSKYVKVFERAGYKVIHSHIDEDKNFFYYEPEEHYDVIISNPPIRAGKKIVHEILSGSYDHLNVGGYIRVVIQKKQGAPSAKAKLEEVFGNCEIIKKDKGYYILQSIKK